RKGATGKLRRASTAAWIRGATGEPRRGPPFPGPLSRQRPRAREYGELRGRRGVRMTTRVWNLGVHGSSVVGRWVVVGRPSTVLGMRGNSTAPGHRPTTNARPVAR